MFLFISLSVLVLCNIIQTTFLPRWPLWGVIPDLNLIVVTCFSLKAGELSGTGFGFIAGIIQDLLSFKSMGISSISKTSAGFLTGTFKETFRDSGFLLVLSLIFANTLINEAGHLLFYFALSTQRVLPPNFISKIALQIFVNMIFTPLFLIFFVRLWRIFNPGKNRYSYE
ncbi:MAG TPA: rod shape-determining protein MreD [Candidatus Eremiobacteraeota bacterium]|nr:rod shape-determining protein MreD [Candidatus Eremiobacteraeota bacterium]